MTSKWKKKNVSSFELYFYYIITLALNKNWLAYVLESAQDWDKVQHYLFYLENWVLNFCHFSPVINASKGALGNLSSSLNLIEGRENKLGVGLRKKNKEWIELSFQALCANVPLELLKC